MGAKGGRQAVPAMIHMGWGAWTVACSTVLYKGVLPGDAWNRDGKWGETSMGTRNVCCGFT